MERDLARADGSGDLDLPAGLCRLLSVAAAMLHSRGIGVTLSMADGTSVPVEVATARTCDGEIDALLTASEVRVARMVACGATNREISARLWVSTKTIESHLTRIYHKLGARTRVELALRVAIGHDRCDDSHEPDRR